MKKEYASKIAIELNDKSDTELIDMLAEFPNSGKVVAIKAILDKRMKRSLQYLTEVTKKNSDNSEKYNEKLKKLTNRIFWLTLVMAIITILNFILVWKQFKYTELATRGERINQKAIILEQKQFCKDNPDAANSGLYTQDGIEKSCAEVLEMSK